MCYLKKRSEKFCFYVQKSQLKTQYTSDTHSPISIAEIIAYKKKPTITTNGVNEK